MYFDSPKEFQHMSIFKTKYFKVRFFVGFLDIFEENMLWSVIKALKVFKNKTLLVFI